MTRKISILFLVILIAFSPVSNVFAEKSDQNKDETEDTKESKEISESDLDEVDSDEETDSEIESDSNAVSEGEATEENSDLDENTTEQKNEENTEEQPMEEDNQDSEEVDTSEETTSPEDELEEKTKEQNISMISTSSSLLKKGVRDKRVVTLKKDLEKIGFKVPGNGTTYFGQDTENKVQEFQVYYGLAADGIVGKATFDKIDSIVNSPFQSGKRHDGTVTLKQNLKLVGLPVPGNGTTLYGKETETRVSEFQRKNGLVVNGIADEVTLRKLDELAVPVLKVGVRHKDVVQLKKDLRRTGFTVPGNETTYFGSDTKKKVQEFQRYYGLSADGIAGQQTLDKITSILNSPLQKGKRHADTIQLKKDLANIGFKVPGNGTNLYGTDTEKVIKNFQKENGLVVNGIADEVTLAKIQELQSIDLKKGMRHPDVIVLKEDLKKIGFPVPGNGTNYFGKDTENVVKEFQEYYGLTKTGVVDTTTFNKLDEVVNSPFQAGKRHPNTPQLKIDLALLGFPVPGDNTTYYGTGTTKQVKAFQKKHKLVENGIADEVTLAKISSLVPQSNVTLRIGDKKPEVILLKQNLAKIGFPVPGNGTNYFGKDTEKKVREFQSYYGLGSDGIVGKQSYAKISEVLSSPLQKGVSHPDTIQLKKDLAALGYKVPGNGTELYGAKTEAKVEEFQKAYGLAVNGIADEVTLIKIQQLLGGNITETSYNITLDEALKIQQKAGSQTDKNYDTYVSKNYINSKNIVTADVLNVRGGANNDAWVVGTLKKGDKVTILGESNGWYQIKYTSNRQWVNASPEDIKYYLNPKNFIDSPTQVFQFLDLSRSSNASATTLNKHLLDKGILEGKASVFIEAGKKRGINEIYLISHSLLETGNGESELATGVKYKGKTVYNMYGIGAYDSCPLECGAKKAYEEGWFTPEAAIKGGADFIAKDYISSDAKQNTLYKMRWNPDAMASSGKYGKQYATDIGWASKQTSKLYEIYTDLGIHDLKLDIPVYK